MAIIYILLGLLFFLASMYLALYVFFIAITFVIYSIDTVSGGKALSPELKAELDDIRKKFSIRHFIRLITFFKK